MQLNSSTIAELSEGWVAANPNTIQLRFDNKDIVSVEAGVFNRYKSLQELHLFGSRITELPEGIFHSLSELKHISLFNNKISSLHPQLFKGNKKLEVIYVYNNEITELNENELFQNLPELNSLGFFGNKIKTFNFECLKDSTKLERLSFHDNELIEIKELENFKKLFPNLKLCSVHNNKFRTSYMQTVVQSLVKQNIDIYNLDKNKGIVADSIYGLECVPDYVYLNSQGIELENKLSDIEVKLKQLNDENTKLRVELTNCKDEIKTLDGKNLILTDDLKNAKVVMWQMIHALQCQPGRSVAELEALRVELNNSKTDGLDNNNIIFEAVRDVNKEDMWQDLQLQQARTDAELKSLREKTEMEVSDLTSQIVRVETSCSSRSDMFNDKVQSFHVLFADIFQMNKDFKIFSDNFKEYNEKIGSHITKFESRITEWVINMETTMKDMHQVMEDYKVSCDKLLTDKELGALKDDKEIE